MAMDPYALCPCGSGKKLKFCCGPIVDEMARVGRLQAGDQMRQAIQILEKLEKSHPENAWVLTTHAEILTKLHETHSAKERLEHVVTAHPEYAPAFGSLAIATLIEEGYEAARPAIHRGFQKCINRAPHKAGQLALIIGMAMTSASRAMAARQYFTLAMRILTEEARQEVFRMLLEIDGNSQIPYPFRSVHNLLPNPAEGERANDVARAHALAAIGCWGPAGRAFVRIAEQEGGTAAAWWNAALCRAWDGDEAGAAEAFHKASAGLQDFEFAVESETLAQLCDFNVTTDCVPFVELEYPVRSAARLLGLLEGNDRILRGPSEDDEDDPNPVAGEFVVCDKPMPTQVDLARVTPEQIPVVTSVITVHDALPEEDRRATLVLQGFEGDAFNTARELVESLARDELDGPCASKTDAAERLPRELLPYTRLWKFPPELPASVRRDLAAAHWRHLIGDVWPNAPQAVLDGKSPLAVKDDPAYRVRLTAAVYVLDSLVHRLGATVDCDRIFPLLGLEPLEPLEPDEHTALSALSAMQLHRLSVRKLSDAQLVDVHRRAMLIGHRRFVRECLEELVSRPQCLAHVNVQNVFDALIELLRSQGRIDEALGYINQVREWAAQQPNAFDLQLSWTIAELLIRAQQPDDPQTERVYRQLADYYAPKVPEIAKLLESFQLQYGGRFSWLASSGVLVGSASGAPAAGGIWTPGGESPSAPSGGKIWLPGQE